MPNIVIIDGNIVFSALLGSKIKLSIIVSPTHKLFAPVQIITELKKDESRMCEYADLTAQKFESYFKAILEYIEIVPYEQYASYMERADKAMDCQHPEDAHYLACALAINADFIWTKDKDFTRQNLVPVKTTKTMLARIKIFKYLDRLISSKFRER